MDRFAHYAWPFFDPHHAKLAAEADAWARENLGHAHGEDADAICKRLVRDLGCAGYLNHAVTDAHDVRELDYLRCGIDVARRAGLEKAAVLNCLSLEDLLKTLKR